MKVIVVEEDTQVYELEIEEHEIPSILESGFISAILRSAEKGIEYAHVDDNDEVEWLIPDIRDE